MRYSNCNLKKLESIFKELDYTVRYEKGRFQSGYCLVESRNVAVINKFFDTEARMNALLEILSDYEFDVNVLSEESSSFYENEVLKHLEKQQKESL